MCESHNSQRQDITISQWKKPSLFKCNTDASFSNSPNMMNKRRLKDCYLSTLETLMFELAKTQNQ